MKLWNYVRDLTSSWHNGGGIVVVAESLERARKIAPGDLREEPDKTYEVGEAAEEFFIFPDAGCC